MRTRRSNYSRFTLCLCCFLLSRLSAADNHEDANVVVIGAGLAGLSAALEAAHGGATVTVLDISSVFGGHAVMSGGDVTIVGTPLQRSKGIRDTPELAFRDFVAWGKDANQAWVRYYVNNSRAEIYDWLTSMGVTFEDLREYPGNTVARAHVTNGRGLGLVSPLYRQCLETPDITFIWNTRAVDLLLDGKHVVGVKGRNLRTGQVREFHARAVIVATGGFQSNLELVREHWPADLPVPDHLLAGSGINSTGSGIELASRAGAATFNMDHQWNYERGLPDPRSPGENRGLNAVVDGVRVNSRGELFLQAEGGSSADALRALLHQPGATYWMVFDDVAKKTFWVAGTDWGSFDTIQRVILDDPSVVQKAATIDELAAKIRLPLASLKKSIAQYNRGPAKIESAPFYAAQFFPMTRKSMGGISIDLQARALDRRGRPVPGLYAAGEVSGEAGINGKSALEGTFLGPAVLIGRQAGRSAVGNRGVVQTTVGSALPSADTRAMMNSFENGSCTGCHNLEHLVGEKREGYWHFQNVHRVVLQRQYQCSQCHSEISLPPNMQSHLINRVAQIDNCKSCHIAQ